MAGPIVGMLKWVQTSPLAIVSRVRGLYGGWFECQELLFVLKLTLSFLNGSDTSYSSGILMLFSTNNLKPLFVYPNTTQKGCFL